MREKDKLAAMALQVEGGVAYGGGRRAARAQKRLNRALLLTGTTLNPLQLNTDSGMACTPAHAHYCFAVLSAQLERKPVPPYTGDDADAELFVPACACRLQTAQHSLSSLTHP